MPEELLDWSSDTLNWLSGWTLAPSPWDRHVEFQFGFHTALQRADTM